MQCRNGHEIEARIIRPDGRPICPVCYRESKARRMKRYWGTRLGARRAEARLFG